MSLHQTWSGPADFQPFQEVGIDPVPFAGLAQVALGIGYFHPHQLQQAPHPFAIDRPTFASQQRCQSPAAIERMLQVQLVEPAHQHQVLLALGHRLVIEAAARDAGQLALLAQTQFGAWLDQISPDRYRPSCLHFFLSQSASTVS